MKFGKELKESIQKELNDVLENQANREERINKGETDFDDCFLSIHTDEIHRRECELRISILDGDGLMDYEAIVDDNGNEIPIHWFKNKYGGMSVVGRGIFANSINALLKKTGWKQETIKVPCWTKICCNGLGMLGVYNSYVSITRWHTNMVTGEYVGYPN